MKKKNHPLCLPLLMMMMTPASTGLALPAYGLSAAQAVAATGMTGTQQSRKVTGRVTDQHGEPLVGASVVVRGTKVMTVTDADGRYSLTLPAGKDEITASYIGAKPQTAKVAGRAAVDFTLSGGDSELGEVVVTALGIERKPDELTYATQKVKGDELTRAKDANLINSLQGKSAGLVITPNASGAGGSSKILLRGNASIMGENQPLIVVDGVPMSSTLRTTQITDALLAGGNTTDGGDALSNINPDDVDNITILKGANAAALYGSMAANGVIMITTKKGKEGHVRLNVSSSMLMETPLVTPKLQNTYGADIEDFSNTWFNPNNPYTDRRLGIYSWGQPIGRLSENALASVPYARNAAMDNIGSYLQTATNFNNTISASFGAGKASNYLSYSNTRSNGMMPGNKFNRHILTFRQNTKLFNERLEISLAGNYVYQDAKNRPGSGIYGNPLYDLYLMPRNADLKYFKHNGEAYGQLYYINAINNTYPKAGPNSDAQGPIQTWPWSNEENRNSPYWYQHRLLRDQVRERFYGTLGLSLKIWDGLSAQTHFKIDRTKDTYESKTYQGTRAKTYYNSIYEYSKSDQNEIYADFLLSYTKKIKEVVDLTANFGGSTWKFNTDAAGWNYWMNDSTSTPNVFDPSNLITNKRDGAHVPVTKTVSEDWKNALYGTISVGYKGFAFVDASWRADWARTYTQFHDMGGSKKYFMYYSAGGNVLLNKLLKLPEDFFINHSKLRVSYSEVGNAMPNMDIYSLKKSFSTGGLTASQYRQMNRIKPERVRSTEVGLDLRFLQDRITFDFTFYNALMVDQWLPQAAATGGSIPDMTGRTRNRGFETTLGYNFNLPSRQFSWRTAVNYSFNKNEILQTYNNNSTYNSNLVYQGGLYVRYEVDKPYGELYGRGYMYGEDGKIKLDPNGVPIKSSNYDTYLGNANSPHHLGWSNTFTWKNLSFYFLIDGKIGGNVISYTEALLDAYGVSERTGKVRDSGLTFTKKGVVGGVEVMRPVAGYQLPDGQIVPAEDYYKAMGQGEPLLQNYTYSATNFRLREASLGYTFRNLFGDQRDLSVSFVARNLFFIYKDSPVDPDISVSTANSYSGIDAFSIPSTRSYGITLKATF